MSMDIPREGNEKNENRGRELLCNQGCQTVFDEPRAKGNMLFDGKVVGVKCIVVYDDWR